MADITDLAQYRQDRIISQFESAWRFLLLERYDVASGMRGISDDRLLFLAQPDDPNTRVIYELVNRTMNGADTTPFETLDMVLQLQIIDIHLFTADRCRFEIMRRLGWLERYIGLDLTLVDFMTRYRELRNMDLDMPPDLSVDHSRFEEFSRLISREKGVFVRKMYPAAILAFHKQL